MSNFDISKVSFDLENKTPEISISSLIRILSFDKLTDFGSRIN